MIGQEIIYAPCPCGSGKKFKFCCYKKYRSQLSDDMSLADVTQLVRCEESGIHCDMPTFSPKSEGLYVEGCGLMKKHEFEKARAAFKRSREADPRHSASWNNEATCAWQTGDYEAAYEIQREGNANMTAIDSFGLARLAVYAHTTDREDKAAEALDAALAVPPISVCGAAEVCFSLALYHRHRDIIDYVAKSGMADSEQLAFYTGIAHANLDEMGPAELDLTKTGASLHCFIPDHYLELIEQGVRPWTTEGEDEWPYFDRHNFQPARKFVRDAANGADPFEHCPKPLVEDCIAFLLADESLGMHDALTFARKLTSDRAKRMVESLERMVKAADESEAQEEPDSAADVDARGRPRVSFDLAYLTADGSEQGLSEAEKESIRLSAEVVDSDLPTTDDAYVRMENLMRGVANAHPDAVGANLSYFCMIEKHDPELALGLMESFCRQHPDDLRCAGTHLMLCVKVGDFADAAEVVDHFSVPQCEIDLAKCQEWGMALYLLSKDDEFRKAQPAAHARVAEFLAKFVAKA